VLLLFRGAAFRVTLIDGKTLDSNRYPVQNTQLLRIGEPIRSKYDTWEHQSSHACISRSASQGGLELNFGHPACFAAAELKPFFEGLGR